MPEESVFSQDAVELFPQEEDNETLPLDPEDRRAVLDRFQRARDFSREGES